MLVYVLYLSLTKSDTVFVIFCSVFCSCFFHRIPLDRQPAFVSTGASVRVCVCVCVGVCVCNPNPKFVSKIISDEINSCLQSLFNWLSNVN